MKYSKYFPKSELLYSKTAKKLGIDLYASLEKLPMIEDSLKCLSWFLTAVREKWNGPIWVSSGYRNKLLNQLVGGRQHSYHCIGQAADIYVEPNRLPDLFNLIKNNFKCDELYINHTQHYIHVSPSNIYAYGKRKNQTDS